MAPSKKKTKKKTTKKKPAARRAGGKTSRKKSATKKKVTKKAPARKTTKKVAKKSTKKSTKKTAKKSAKKTAKRTSKKTGKKVAATSSRKKVTKTTKKKAPAKTVTAGKKKKTTAASKKTASKPASSKKTTKKKRTRAGDADGPHSVAQAARGTEADAQGYVFINGRRVRMISTKGIAPAAKKKAQADAETTSTQEKKPKKIKTHLSRKELAHYQRLLLERRAELVGSLSSLEEQALKSGDGDVSHMPIHMADLGTDTYDQDLMLGLAEGERRHLREIDEALQRIQARTYGVCELSGEPIPKARLDAKPWAKYTIESARLLESGWHG